MPFRWGCPITNHLLPHHNARMVHDMAFIITPQYGVWPYHSDGVALPPTICYRTTTRGLRTTWHLSSRHNMGCDHAIPMGLSHHQPFITAPQRDDGPRHGIYHHATTWDCAPHGHSLPSHAIEIVRIIAIYHHATMRGMVMPSCGVACRMAIHRHATA